MDVVRSAARLRVALLVPACLAALAFFVPVASARTAANLSLNVSFFTNGTITVTLPDGTPVGTSAGNPTMIPAGYYAVLLNGPGGCTALPHFILKGPGENITDNMTEGEMTNFEYNAYFLPNSTYTWRDDANPNVVYTFATTSDVEGAAPAAPGSAGVQSSNHGTAQSQDLIGSKSGASSKGSLTGAVSKAGALTLALKGKAVSSLAAGKYTISVTDSSKKSGFMLVEGKKKLMLTSAAFVGKHTGTVTLSAGRWSLLPSAGGKAIQLTVK